MFRYIGHIFLIIMSITACANETDIMQVYTPESVNKNIMPIHEAKLQLTRRILSSEYARNLLKRFPHMEAINWGPVVLVENIGIEDECDYYYAFHGIMPDNAIVYMQTINAYNGELLAGAVIKYNSVQKTFLLSANDAREYAMSKFDISENAAVKAVFYRDRATRSIYRDSSWKYKIFNSDGGPVQTSQGDVKAVYVDPFVTSIDAVPAATNIIGRFYTTRLTALEPIQNFRGSLDGRILNDRQFVALE